MGEQTAEVEWASMNDMPYLAKRSMAGVFSPILALNAETESMPMSSPRIRMTFGLSGAAIAEDDTPARIAMLARVTDNTPDKNASLKIFLTPSPSPRLSSIPYLRPVLGSIL